MIALLALGLFQQEPNFSRLFPHPTGANGYEEYVRAGDMLSNQDFVDFESEIARSTRGPGQNLDPNEKPPLDFLTALRAESSAFPLVNPLIAEGNQKQIQDPRRSFTPDTLFPEMMSFKAIAKYQSHCAYVDFAEGKSAEGLQILLDGLTFAHKLSASLTISRMVGVACQSIYLRELDRHLNQLCLSDSQYLDSFALAEIGTPPQTLNCLDAEWQMNLNALDLLRNSTLVANTHEFDSKDQKWSALSPAEQSAVIDQVQALDQSSLRQCGQVLSGPEAGWIPYLDSFDSTTENPSMAQTMFEYMGVGDLAKALTRVEAIKRTQFHLLHLTAKVLQYKWTHGQLPESLDQCVRPEEIADQVFGGRFNYVRKGRTFQLGSSGSKSTGPVALYVRHAVAPSNEDNPSP